MNNIHSTSDVCLVCLNNSICVNHIYRLHSQFIAVPNKYFKLESTYHKYFTASYRFYICKGHYNHISIFIWCTHLEVYIICLSLMLIIFGFSFPKLDLMLESSVLSSSCESFSSCCNFSSIELSSSNPHSQQQYSVNPVLKMNVDTIYVPSLLRLVKICKIGIFPSFN